MRILKLHLILSLASSVLAVCENSEIAAIMQENPFSIFFIYAAEGISNASFDFKTFLRLVEFTDTSHKLPLVVYQRNNFISRNAGTYSCDEEHFLGFITRMLLSPPNLTMSGVLYGCDVQLTKAMRFIVYENASWSYEDKERHCKTFLGLPSKYFSKMNWCKEDFKAYSKKCLLDQNKKESEPIDMILIGIFLMISILIFGYKTYKHFKVNSISY